MHSNNLKIFFSGSSLFGIMINWEKILQWTYKNRISEIKGRRILNENSNVILQDKFNAQNNHKKSDASTLKFQSIK